MVAAGENHERQEERERVLGWNLRVCVCVVAYVNLLFYVLGSCTVA